MGAGTTETGVALILLATSTAVAGYVLADQMDGDSALAANAVAVSTLLSPISLGIVIALI
jgi:predicted permease